MKAESKTHGDRQIIHDITTLAGVLLLLDAPVNQESDDQHLSPLARESTELRVLAESDAPIQELRLRALNAIALAENTVHDLLRDVTPESDASRAIRVKTSRFSFFRGSKHGSSPAHALTHPDDEIALLQKSSQQLLAKLTELRQRIANGATEPVASVASVTHA